MIRLLLTTVTALCALTAAAQSDTVTLSIVDDIGAPVEFTTVEVVGTGSGAVADVDGVATVVLPKGYPVQLSISSVGLETLDTVLSAQPSGSLSLKPNTAALQDVVVTGTLSPVLRTESPVAVEVYTRKFLLADPTPSLFETMQNVNGVRPQLNCAVCNTGGGGGGGGGTSTSTDWRGRTRWSPSTGCRSCRDWPACTGCSGYRLR